jgi:pSer/pThr/pTyr-binding forkhead associated (FHA) protein
MTHVSFHVIDGVDKGRKFANVQTPVTIGREEGNAVRLNDDRVSRFHAKVQVDQGQVVLTDLDSTNGTRVNGETVQLRLLRPGDRVQMGRSTLVYGSDEEIADSLGISGHEKHTKLSDQPSLADSVQQEDPATELPSPGVDYSWEEEASGDVFLRSPPALPNRLSPAQAAQFSEVIDFLHMALARATQDAVIPVAAREARLTLLDWHRIQQVVGFLADYSRQVAEPDKPSE